MLPFLDGYHPEISLKDTAMLDAIKVECPCGKALKIKRDYAGKRVKCPGCGEAFVVNPSSASAKLMELTCECGQLLKASTKLAGKRAKCPACGNRIEVPKAFPNSRKPLDLTNDPLGLGDLEDLSEESTAAPVRLRRKSSAEFEATREKSSKRKKQRRPSRPQSRDSTGLVIGLACMLHGILSLGSLAIFRIAGLQLLASHHGLFALAPGLIGIGFFVCGVGLVMQQPWSEQLVYSLALVAVGWAVVGLVRQGLLVLPRLPANVAMSVFASTIIGMVPSLIVPIVVIQSARR